MLNERDSRVVQPSLTATETTASQGAAKNELMVFPEWLNERLRTFAAAVMPGATMSEVVVRCCAVGAGALDGARLAERMAEAAAKPAPASSPASKADPWEVRMYHALFAAASTAGGSLTVDGESVMRLAQEATSGQTRRAVGYVLGYRARDYGKVKCPRGVLLIEPIGRPAGSALHQYRLTTVDG